MRQPTWLPIIPIGIAVFILLSPIIITGKTIYWGTPALQFVPWRELASDIIRTGQVPLWNPYLGMGAPLLANYQLGIFYPPNWTLFLLDFVGDVEWLAWGQACLVSFHLLLAGWGMARLSAEMGMKPLAQIVSGLAFGLSGYLVSRAGFLSINAAAAWLPWILLWVTRMIRGRRKGLREYGLNLLVLSVVLAMQLLAGHAQTAWYTLLLGGMWAGYFGWHFAYSHRVEARGESISPKEGPALKQRFLGVGVAWAGFGLSIVIGCILSGIQLLPTAEYLIESQRSGAVDFDYAMNYSFWPWHLLTLLAPDIFGNPAHGNYWGYANYWEDALYVGLLPFIMALAAVLKGNRSLPDDGMQANPLSFTYPPKSLISFSLVISGISLLFALGKNTPVFPWLYTHIWTFDMFQAPARFILWVEFGLALLAGIGVHSWRRPVGRALYWTRLGTAGAFAVMLGAGLTWVLMGDIRPTFIRAAALAGFWAIWIGVLSLSAPQPETISKNYVDGMSTLERPQTTLWSVGVVVLVIVDLLFAGWGLNPGVDTKLFKKSSPNAFIVNDMPAGSRIYLPPEDEQEIKYEQYFRFDTFISKPDIHTLRAVLLPNINVLDRVPSVNNFDPLVPERYQQWMEELGNRFPERWTGEIDSPDLMKINRILNLMGVGFVEEMELESHYGVVFVPVEQQITLDNKNQRQNRYYWFNCTRGVRDGREALNLIFNDQVDLSRELILESKTNTSQENCSQAHSEATIKVMSESPNRYELDVEADTSGWLFVGDVWYPGWQALVDGRRVDILRGNYLFRAIAIAPGTHRIVFSYQPLSFWSGTLTSVVGWLTTICIVFLLSRNIRASEND